MSRASITWSRTFARAYGGVEAEGLGNFLFGLGGDEDCLSGFEFEADVVWFSGKDALRFNCRLMERRSVSLVCQPMSFSFPLNQDGEG
jgi:hypothetical protein